MQLRGLHDALKPNAQWALDVAEYYGVPVTVTSIYRSWGEQAELRRRYEQGKSRFPANQPGDSAHNYGLAWDSTVPDRYQEWWDYVRRLAGFEVLSNDRIHAQLFNWRGYVAPRAA